MHRRQFLSSTLAASALTLAGEAAAVPANAQSAHAEPEFYQLRKYFLASGPQTKLANSYFADALIPALNRLGITPVGAFSMDVGPQTPTYYLLMPCSSLETLTLVDHKLAKDDAFVQAAAPFWGAPAVAPAFSRVESQLMRAFPGYPKLTPPPTTAAKAKRMFQLRTYESPSYKAHVAKVEMFHSGEFDFFQASGASQVFYGDNLIGQRLPSLTYMLSFPDLATLEKCWANFQANPEWKKLSSSAKYSYEAIVSNVDNEYLKPLASSQI